jgi:ABC-type nitrate/sulfonate/bicarbonate transport system substrate-binding protein
MIEISLGGGAAGFNWLPVYVAQEKGFFEQRGVAVSIRKMGTVDKATAGVQSGELNMAITPPEGAIRDCAQGGGLRIVAGNANRLPLTLVANARFKRIEDLKGATLGTSSLTEGTAIYTMEILARHGLNYPSDYAFSVVGVHPARWKALQEGAIDAAVQPPPFNFMAIDAGYSNLGEASEYIPDLVFTAVIVHRDWADKNRAAIVAMLAALIDATQWTYDAANDDKLVPIMMELNQCDETYARRALHYMRDMNLFPRDLSIPKEAIAKSLELMRAAKLADEAMLASAEAVLDDSFRAEAQKLVR